jgi:hypothetical protein
MSDATMLKCDVKPLLFFIQSFDRALKVAQRPLDIGDVTFKLVRVESNRSPADANEVGVTLYPSDAFLNLVATVCARDLDFITIE